MRRFSFIPGLMVSLSLSLAVGCASRAPAPVATPVSTTSADVASDPSYTPPNEDGFVMVEKPASEVSTRKPISAAPPSVALPSPNAEGKPRGSVRAATN